MGISWTLRIPRESRRDEHRCAGIPWLCERNAETENDFCRNADLVPPDGKTNPSSTFLNPIPTADL